MTLLDQLSELLAYLLLFAGCVLLHVRLRRLSSLSFLFSLAALLVWILWGQSALWHLLPTPPGTEAAELLQLEHSYPIFAAIELLLLLWFGFSFFFTVKAIQPASREAA